jgi:hypothetical protein
MKAFLTRHSQQGILNKTFLMKALLIKTFLTRHS